MIRKVKRLFLSIFKRRHESEPWLSYYSREEKKIKFSKLSIYDTLNQFKEQWERVPQQRFMQLIHNFQ